MLISPILLSLSIQSTIQSVIISVPIISSNPIISQQTKLIPKKVCREINSPTHNQIYPNHIQPQSNFNNLGGMILGGVLGSMVGKNESQRRIGGVVGSIIGNRVSQNISNSSQNPYNQPPINHITNCYSSWSNEVVDEVVGYKVVYELDGKIYEKVLNYQPSSHIKIRKKIVVDGVIDNNSQILTPNQLQHHLNNNLNDDYEILDGEKLDEYEIEELKDDNFKHPYSKRLG